VPEVVDAQAFAVTAQLAAMLPFLRGEQGRGDQLGLAFRALLSELGANGLELRSTDGGLVVHGVPISDDVPGAQEVRAQLRGHGIGVLRFGPGLTPTSVLAVLRPMAMPAGRFGHLEALVAEIDAPTRALVQIEPEATADPAGAVLPDGYVSDLDFIGAVKASARYTTSE